MQVSDINSETTRDSLGVIHGSCDICKRDNVRLIQHGFGISKTVVDWFSKGPVTDNPIALTVAICGTDLNLLARIKRDTKGKLSPKLMMERAIAYRETNGIKVS